MLHRFDLIPLELLRQNHEQRAFLAGKFQLLLYLQYLLMRNMFIFLNFIQKNEEKYEESAVLLIELNDFNYSFAITSTGSIVEAFQAG